MSIKNWGFKWQMVHFKILFGKNFTMLILFLIILICCPTVIIGECGIKQTPSSMTMEAKVRMITCIPFNNPFITVASLHRGWGDRRLH